MQGGESSQLKRVQEKDRPVGTHSKSSPNCRIPAKKTFESGKGGQSPGHGIIVGREKRACLLNSELKKKGGGIPPTAFGKTALSAPRHNGGNAF